MIIAQLPVVLYLKTSIFLNVPVIIGIAGLDPGLVFKYLLSLLFNAVNRTNIPDIKQHFPVWRAHTNRTLHIYKLPGE